MPCLHRCQQCVGSRCWAFKKSWRKLRYFSCSLVPSKPACEFIAPKRSVCLIAVHKLIRRAILDSLEPEPLLYLLDIHTAERLKSAAHDMWCLFALSSVRPVSTLSVRGYHRAFGASIYGQFKRNKNKWDQVHFLYKKHVHGSPPPSNGI